MRTQPTLPSVTKPFYQKRSIPGSPVQQNINQQALWLKLKAFSTEWWSAISYLFSMYWWGRYRSVSIDIYRNKPNTIKSENLKKRKINSGHFRSRHFKYIRWPTKLFNFPESCTQPKDYTLVTPTPFRETKEHSFIEREI